MNNTDRDVLVPWSDYKEIVSGPQDAVDVISELPIKLSNETLVPAGTVLIAEII